MESPVSGRMIESHQRQDDVPEFVAIAEALDYTRQSYFGRCVASEMPVGVSLIFERIRAGIDLPGWRMIPRYVTA